MHALKAADTQPEAADVRPAQGSDFGNDAGGEFRPPMRTGYYDQLIDSEVWQCNVCTLTNAAAARRCAACKTPKPTHDDGGSARHSATEASHPAPGGANGSMN